MVDWARSAVAPVGGSFRNLAPHALAVPLIQALLQRTGLPVQAVDAVIAGNALGAGGNPARMSALAAGLPDTCAALSIDTQCCSGLDAISTAVGWIASGQASVVIAGGVEAWSRAPIRHHRPQHPDEVAQAYERPAFAPDPARDPDLLVAAAQHAALRGYTRQAQDSYAVQSHARALAACAALQDEIVPMAGLAMDAYPRALDMSRVARMPVAVSASSTLQHDRAQAPAQDCSLTPLTISAKADGAAFVLLMSAQAAERWHLTPRAAWRAGASVGVGPETPLLAAEQAARAVLQRAALASLKDVDVVELHDAFAVQGLDFCKAFALNIDSINQRGGGLARGHPIGASGAIALVRVLADLQSGHARGATGLAAIAGAGGIGAAAIVERL
jgi:acetyl-CoA C-acetyltransferase